MKIRNENIAKMKIESNRIFISDLPETATEEQIQKAFGEYGEVKHIDIKERKELGQKNTSLFFAYVTITTDAKKLQNCFNDFSNGKWLGQYVMLQVARESFLDRLKRERENNQNSSKTENLSKDSAPVTKKQELKLNGTTKVITKKYESSDPDSTSSESEEESQNSTNLQTNKRFERKSVQDFIECDPDFVIKNNRSKSVVPKVLKIESVGNEPIIKIELGKKKPVLNTSEANLKRLESLKNFKREYQNQKSLIQAALSNVDTKQNNKITFGDTTKKQKIHTDKKSLFKESDSEEEFEPSFSVKDHFQGEEGQKLLELQTKYKNDKRFTLNERFLNSNEMEVEEIKHNFTNNDEMSLEEEKKNEYQILGQILGKKILPKEDRQNSRRKKMLRFDPSQPEHSKYEIAQATPGKKEKRKRKNSDTEKLEEKRREEKDAPEVSKEVFFKVSGNLKQTFEEKKEFSLLSMFGKPNEEKSEELGEKEININKASYKLHKEKNPFKYDSSDDEDETKDIPDQNKADKSYKTDLNEPKKNNVRKLTPWTDPFFFKLDDYRLQEGFDFVEKLKSEENTEFTKLRRDLKEIVKAKVRNNLRRNRPFKKKLGGNRKKKVLRMKKAMKR